MYLRNHDVVSVVPSVDIQTRASADVVRYGSILALAPLIEDGESVELIAPDCA
jgi:hypothetical protein